LDARCYVDDSCGENETAPKSSTFDIAFKYATVRIKNDFELHQ